MTVNTTELEVHTETTAYGLAKSFSSDPDAKSPGDTEWLEMARNQIYIEEDIDVINEQINEVLGDNKNDEATNSDKIDDEDDPAYAEWAYFLVMVEMFGKDVNLLTTTTESMQALDVLSRYFQDKGFDKATF